MGRRNLELAGYLKASVVNKDGTLDYKFGQFLSEVVKRISIGLLDYYIEKTRGTFTSNDPASGYVSWSGIQITYDGARYDIDDGNTNKTWVYWDSSIPTVFYSDNTKPVEDEQYRIIMKNDGGVFIDRWNGFTGVIADLASEDIIVETIRNYIVGVSNQIIMSFLYDIGLTASHWDLTIDGDSIISIWRGHPTGSYNRVTIGQLDVDIADGALYIDGTKVLAQQQGAVTDPSGGTTVDAECRAALIDLMDALRNHGVIAT